MKTWHRLIRGKKVLVNTPEKGVFVRRFSDVMLCERMGWSERQMNEENSEEFINDAMTIFTMQSSHEAGLRKIQENKAKR